MDNAVRLYDAQNATAMEQENAVSDDQRNALSSKRAELVEEVRIKNEKVKSLIDQLRELYRDALVFRNIASAYSKTSSSGL